MQAQESETLLLVAFKRLDEQQKLLKYFMQEAQLFIRYIALYDHLNVCLSTVVISVQEHRLILSTSGSHGYCCPPEINQEEKCTEIIFCLDHRDSLVLRFSPGRVEMSWSRLRMASHEYPLELQSHVDKQLAKAIASFGWLK